MTTEQLIKKKTIKYFIQQKIVEIILGILIIIGIVFIPYWLGHYIGDNQSTFCDFSHSCDMNYIGDCNENAGCGKFAQWGEGLLYLIGGIVVLGLGILLFKVWFSYNWEKAKRKAEADFGSDGEPAQELEE